MRPTSCSTFQPNLRQITGSTGALTAVTLFRRHYDGFSLSSGQGKQVEGMTRKRSEVVPGCRGCRRFDRVERTINLRGVVAAFCSKPKWDLSDRVSEVP